MKCKIVLEFFIVFVCVSLAVSDSKPEKPVGDAELQTNFVPENLGSLSKRNEAVPATTIKNIETSSTEKKRGDHSAQLKKKRKFEPSTSGKKMVIKADQKETDNNELSHIEIIPKKTKAIESTGGKNAEIDGQKTKADEKTGNQERVRSKDLIEDTKVDPKTVMKHIEIVPQATTEDGKLAVKRNPKDGADNADETRESMDESIHRPKFPILKGLKRPPKIGAREDLSAESNLGKAMLVPKQQTTTNPCASPAIKNQLRNAADRISRLTERMNHAGFGCAVLNNEIESIKMLLQQAEVKQKEMDRTKIRDQIRERQAKIHARFGKIEFAKPKRPLLGRSKSREDDVDQSNGKIVSEPADLYET